MRARRTAARDRPIAAECQRLRQDLVRRLSFRFPHSILLARGGMTPQPVVASHSPPIGLVNRIDDMGEEDLGAVQRHHTRQIVQERSRVVLIASNDQLHGASLRPFGAGRRAAANRLDIGALLVRDRGSRDSPNQDQKLLEPDGPCG